MGTANIPAASDGTIIPAADHNALASALKDNLVPRNASGDAEADAGELGTDTYPWKKAAITAGYFFPGQVMMFHDFNGTLSPGQGWMKCNGDVVSEANYDAIHGAGSWDEYVGSSPLSSKNLPNMNNKFPVGATNTTQTGSSAITFEGNASHQINLAHTHVVSAHRHQYTTGGGGGVGPQAGTENIRTWNSSGTLQNYQNGSAWANYTDVATANGTDNGTLSTTQSIKPESCAFEFWMRII